MDKSAQLKKVQSKEFAEIKHSPGRLRPTRFCAPFGPLKRDLR